MDARRIIVDKLSLRYRGASNFAIRNLSFSSPSPGITAIVGKSGIGKSTLISAVAGIYNAADRDIQELTGASRIDGMKPEQLRGPAQVSWVPQVPILFEHLTVLENVLLPATLLRQASLEFSLRSKEAESLLERAGLADSIHLRPRVLSGGMAARVSLLRAIITRPKILFLDEPFRSLDLENRWHIYALVRELRGEEAVTILTTHDLREAALLAERVVWLRHDTDRTSATVIGNSPLTIPDFKDPEGFARATQYALDIEIEQIFGTDDESGRSNTQFAPSSECT